MNTFFRYTIYNLKSGISKKYFFFGSIFLAIFSSFKVLMLAGNSKVSILDAVFIIFCGPVFNNNILNIYTLQWLLMQLIILIIYGELIYSKLCKRVSMSMIRIRSKKTFCISMFFSIFIELFLFLAISTIEATIILFRHLTMDLNLSVVRTYFNINSDLKDLHLTMILLVMIFISLFTTLILQNIFSVILISKLKAAVLTITCCLVSLIFGRINNVLLMIIPNGNSIILKHNIVPEGIKILTFNWSITYNIIILLLSCIAFILFVDRRDNL